MKRSGDVIRDEKTEPIGGGVEISLHNQVTHFTSKTSQNQQNQLQTEIMLGLEGVWLSYANTTIHQTKSQKKKEILADI